MSQPDLELTILMPCLNEAETVAICVAKARDYLARSGISGEVLIADNGSTDGSQTIATGAGARVIGIPEKGYGAALAGGIAAARGRFVIMGDADDSYDFAHLDPFVAKLRDGHQLVMGNRFAGGVAPGAMPWHHRYIGNPVLSFAGRLFFRSKVGDFHCGLRGVDRAAIMGLNLRTSGMEFASEMVVKATLSDLSIAEVPTTLQPDGRTRAPHLRSFRDGWRHLRFLLLFSPRWLFLYPGLTLLGIGLFLSVLLANGQVPLGPSIRIGIHTYIMGLMFVILGVQAISFAVIGRRFASMYGFIPRSRTFDSVLQALTLERILVAAVGLVGIAVVMLVWGFVEWALRGFGNLYSPATIRAMLVAMTALVVGVQMIMTAFLASMLNIPITEHRVIEAVPQGDAPQLHHISQGRARKKRA
jgi:glycosyltransferase involved in cell wall biosynthesis